jgi:CheY-like chemotaxis protein
MDALKERWILLGEDAENDVILFRFWLRKAQVAMKVLVLDSGEKILDYLSGAGDYADRKRFPMPELIFLDGQLHHRPSMGVLRWILESPETQGIPVVVLTGSLDPKVRKDAKAIGALECFEKPFTVQDWKKLDELLTRQGRHSPLDCGARISAQG